MYHDIILVPNILGICEVGCLVSYLHIDGRHHHVQNHCEHNAKRRICSCTCIGIPRRDCLGQKYFGCLVSHPTSWSQPAGTWEKQRDTQTKTNTNTFNVGQKMGWGWYRDKGRISISRHISKYLSWNLILNLSGNENQCCDCDVKTKGGRWRQWGRIIHIISARACLNC